MPRRPFSLCTQALIALLTLVGCGSSGPLGLPGPVDLSETYPSPLRNFEGSLSGTGVRDTDEPLRVGDDVDDLSWRAFTSFAMEAAKPGRTLQGAGLRLHQGGLRGDPYSVMGVLFVERIDMGAAFDAADWSAAAGASSAAWTDPSTGEIEIDVTALVAEALTLGTSRVDMRLRFTLTVNADGVAQQTQFTSYTQGVAPLSLPPILELQWRDTP